MSKKGRINKKKLLLVIVIFLTIIFLIVKMALAIKGHFTPKEKVEVKVKSQREIEDEKNRIINIVIDPAKGGIVEGMSTPDGSMKEKDINLDIARMVKTNLEKHKDVKVYLTREYDQNVENKKRAESIKGKNADLLVSIRLNAQGRGKDAKGMDTFYSNFTSIGNQDDEEKASISPKKDDKQSDLENDLEGENKTNDKKKSGYKKKIRRIRRKKKNNSFKDNSTKDNSLKDNSSKDNSPEDENEIGDDEEIIEEIVEESDEEREERLANEKKQEELDKIEKRNFLARKLAESIQSTTLSYVDFNDRGINGKNFDILLYSNVPSVIVQCGFISNDEDGKKLQDEEERQDIAKGISEGILNYVDSYRNDIIKDRVNYR